MKIFVSLPWMALIMSCLISAIAASSESSLPQNDLIKCSHLKQQIASLKANDRPVSKGSNRQIENYVFSGLIGNQIKRSQTRNSADKRFKHLSNQYALKCGK